MILENVMVKMKMLFVSAIAMLLLLSCDKKQLEPESREVFGSMCMVNLYESGTEKLYGKIFGRLEEIDNTFSSDEKTVENSSRVFQLGNETKKYHSEKGFAIEEIKEIAKKANVKCMIVNLNGKVFVQGSKTDKTPWRIGIKNPANPNGISIAVLTGINNASVMTKAEFADAMNTSRKYPSVTVIGTDSIYADNCSSYIFDLLNSDLPEEARRDSSTDEKISEICERLRKRENKLVIVDADGRIFASKELEGYLGASLDDYEIVFK